MTDQTAQQNSPGRSTKRSLDEATLSCPSRERKRERYTLVACSYCKSKKVKCSGTSPCRRCQNLKLECGQEPLAIGNHQSQAALAKIQDDIARLMSTMDKLSRQRAFDTNFLPRASDSHTPKRHPSHRWPAQGAVQSTSDTESISPRSLQNQPVHATSFLNDFNAARTVLVTTGVIDTDADDDTTDHFEVTCIASRFPSMCQLVRAIQPVIYLGLAEATRVILFFEEAVFPVYPCVDIHSVRRHLEAIFNATFGSIRNSLGVLDSSFPTITQVEIVKAVLGFAIFMEDPRTTSQLGGNLVDSLSWSLEDILLYSVADVDRVVLICLVGLYIWHADDVVRAWRVIGVAARACLELGLHRIPDDDNGLSATTTNPWNRQLFYIVYIMDRRCSFASGLPFAMHDSCIDDNIFPKAPPTTLLDARVLSDRLSSELFLSLKDSSTATSSSNDAMQYMDFKIKRFAESLSPEFTFHNASLPSTLNLADRTLLSQRALLTIRVRYMTLLLHRRCLHSSRDIQMQVQSAEMALDAARDIIAVTTSLSAASNIGFGLCSTFDYFVLAAVSVILLACSHDCTTFGPSYGALLHTAIKLLSDSPGRPYTPQRLWCSLDKLKLIAAQLRLPPSGNASQTSSQFTSSQISDIIFDFSTWDVLPSNEDLLPFIDSTYIV